MVLNKDLKISWTCNIYKKNIKTKHHRDNKEIVVFPREKKLNHAENKRKKKKVNENINKMLLLS